MAFGGIYLCLVDQGQRAQISPAMAHLSTAGDSPRRRTKQQSCNSTEGHELEGGEVSYLAGRKDAIIAPSLTEDCKRRLNDAGPLTRLYPPGQVWWHQGCSADSWGCFEARVVLVLHYRGSK
nr:uncharacterized protein LOC110362498 isoform X5 [Columba livia]